MLKDFLFPEESIRYQSPTQVKHGNDYYTLFITDLRLIAYKRSGLIIKKDKIRAERLDDIQSLSYNERGVLTKKGVFQIETPAKKMTFEGKVADMKRVWQITQEYIKGPDSSITGYEGSIESESIILQFCPFCGGKLVFNAKFCNLCGKKFDS